MRHRARRALRPVDDRVIGELGHHGRRGGLHRLAAGLRVHAHRPSVGATLMRCQVRLQRACAHGARGKDRARGAEAGVHEVLDRLARVTVLRVEPRDRGAVRDGPRGVHAHRGDRAPAGLHHPRTGAVRHEEARPVRTAPSCCGIVAAAALPVRLDVHRDLLDRLDRARRTLEGETHEVHPGESIRRAARVEGRVDRLVPHRHAGGVHAVLGAPAPRRHGQHARHRVLRVGSDLRPRGAHGRRVAPCRHPHQVLALRGRPVGVLGEQGGAARRPRGEGDEAVTHRCARARRAEPRPTGPRCAMRGRPRRP